MNKSVVLKNRIILYFSFLITFFIFLYLVYFLVYGQRGLLQYFYLNFSSNDTWDKWMVSRKNYDSRKNVATQFLKFNFSTSKGLPITFL